MTRPDEIVTTLTRRRVHLGLSQREVARRVGTPVSNVHYWESGAHEPTLHNLRAWAKALGYDLVLRRSRMTCSCGHERADGSTP